MIRAVGVVVLFLYFCSSAFADIYKWVDESGKIYITDDPGKIPEKQKPSPPTPPQLIVNTYEEKNETDRQEEHRKRKIAEMSDAEKKEEVKRLLSEAEALNLHTKEEIKILRQGFDWEIEKIRQQIEDAKPLRGK